MANHARMVARQGIHINRNRSNPNENLVEVSSIIVLRDTRFREVLIPNSA
jgi:hypothetical protein